MKPLYKIAISKNDIFTISKISIFMLFLLMLWSMLPWFAWGHRREFMLTAFSSCFLLLRFVLFARDHNKQTIVYSVLIVIAFAFLVNFMVRLRNAGGLLHIFNFFRVVLVFVFVMAMNRDEKNQIVTMTTSLYAWIMGISMGAYLLFLAGVNLPYSILTVDNPFYPPFRNYRLFILLDYGGLRGLSQRFQSVFPEPGDVGNVSALLLYINRYELKRKSVLIIFISVLLSLSLAGFILMFFGYIIQMIVRSKKIYKTLLKITVITMLLVSIGFIYYTMNPESLFSRLILSRLEIDDEGGIVGNNRVTEHFDRFYETHFLTSTENMLWGINLTDGERWVLFGRGGVNSYRVFLLNNGIVALMLLFFMFFSIVAITPSRLGFGLLVLYSVAFLQRTQTPFWEMTLFLFVGAVQYFHTSLAKFQPRGSKRRYLKLHFSQSASS